MTSFLRRRRLRIRLLHEKTASAAIELAVTLPCLFLFLFCFMEACLAFYCHNMISEMAREGTRYAMVRGASCANPVTKASCTVTAADVNTFVSKLGYPNLAGGTLTPSTVYSNAGAVGSTVTVTVTYVFKITMPLVSANTITMSSSSQVYIIQ